MWQEKQVKIYLLWIRGDTMENHLMPYQSVITQIKSILLSGWEVANSASSKVMLLTYWNIGKRIIEQELDDSERAEYGKMLDFCIGRRFDKGVCQKLS